MTRAAVAGPSSHGAASRTASPGVASRPLALVWIDAREAIVTRRRAGEDHVERIESDVPAHHRATGHVRHDPGVRHGGGGAPQTAGEPRRLEHLARFRALVMERLDPDDDLLILGPGTVPEGLARSIREDDVHHGRSRSVRVAAAARLTLPQLRARLRVEMGEAPRRRAVGT